MMDEPENLTWQDRIDAAKTDGEFSPEDRDLSGSWGSCRVSEVVREARNPDDVLWSVRRAFEHDTSWSLQQHLETTDALAIAEEYVNGDLLATALALLGYAFNLAVFADDFDSAQVLHDAIGKVL